MRTTLRLGALGIALALVCAASGAVALGSPAVDPYAGFNEQSLTTDALTPTVAQHPAPAAGVQAQDAPGAHRAPGGLARTAVATIIGLAAAAFAAGLALAGAIGARAMDGRDAPVGGLADQRPDGLLRANLAILDSLTHGYPARGTRA